MSVVWGQKSMVEEKFVEENGVKRKPEPFDAILVVYLSGQHQLDN